jgi:hypothetical protein
MKLCWHLPGLGLERRTTVKKHEQDEIRKTTVEKEDVDNADFLEAFRLFAIANSCDCGNKLCTVLCYDYIEHNHKRYLLCYFNKSMASRNSQDNKDRDSFVVPLETEDVERIVGEKPRRLSGFASVYSDGSRDLVCFPEEAKKEDIDNADFLEAFRKAAERGEVTQTVLGLEHCPSWIESSEDALKFVATPEGQAILAEHGELQETFLPEQQGKPEED